MWDLNLTKHMYFNACIYNINVTWTVIKYHFSKRCLWLVCFYSKLKNASVSFYYMQGRIFARGTHENNKSTKLRQY